MSPEDDTTTTPRILDINLAEMNDRNIRNGGGNHTPQNGHAKNGRTNGYHNNGMENLNGNGHDTHILAPLLQKDSTLSAETVLLCPSNNNEWKDSEGLNNLKNGMHKSHGNNNGSLMNGKNGFGVDKLTEEEDPLTGVYSSDKLKEDDPSCGIFSCRPKWARCFASTNMFMVVFLFAWVLQGMYQTYFVSVITTIEKLFQIKSKTIGMLLSAGEVGQISTALLLTYFAGRGHRPRWIGIGMVVFAIATLCCSLPHFIFGQELMNSSQFSLNSGETLTNNQLMHLSNGSARENLPQIRNLCYLSNSSFSGDDDECQDDVKIEQASHSKITVIVLCIFAVSLLSAGVGQTAVSTLGIPYIDDNVASRESPIYLAITVGVRILGPATGFIVGSFCARVYVYLSDPGFGPSDPRWISAWWLGPIIISALMMLSSIAMFSFPKELRKNRPQTPAELLNNDKENVPKESTPKLKDFPRTVKRQLSNDILMFRTASSVFHLLPIAGLYTFLPKYLETQFRLPAADANLISAFGGILVMGLGIFLSGIVILKIKPNAQRVAAWIAFTAFVYSVGMVILMFVGCSMDDFVGLKVNEDTSLKSFEPTCTTSCHCDPTKFEPICGADGKIYFSPCHAGCSLSVQTNGTMFYKDCGCLTDFIADHPEFSAVGGYCDTKCKSFILFICIFTILVFVHSTQEVGSILLIMRCTDPKDKAMAMGVIQSAIGIFGNVPCSILYGAIIDSTCLIWKTVCGKPGACSLYDTDVFRRYFLGMTASIMFLAFLMDLVVWKKAHRIDIAPDAEIPKETDSEKPAITPESSV